MNKTRSYIIGSWGVQMGERPSHAASWLLPSASTADAHLSTLPAPAPAHESSIMSTVTVNVKWGKTELKNVEVDLSQPGAAFKAQLFSLTGVPPERQKVGRGRSS